jgi:chemotaxis protein methyltransferase CheR
VSTSDLARFRTLAYDRFGIVIADDAESFMRSRLRTFAAENGHGTLEGLVAAAIENGKDDLLLDIVERISTNHSYFYREPAHFEFMRNHALPETERRMAKSRSKDVRIWSAAAAAGEEAYSIVMAMHDYFGPHYKDLDAGVLATDIAKGALRRGAAGIYRGEAFRHVPDAWRDRFLEQVGEDRYRVIKPVRDDVMFRWLNLNGRLDMLRGGFHIIFCRNVMIYFDERARERLVQALEAMLAPGGFLFIGHTDDAEYPRRYLEQLRPAIFRKAAR